MKAVDSSVVIAAFATWHEHHSVARKAMSSRPRLVAHAAVESYSVLTRLPPPHRASPSIVHAFITQRFTEPFLTLSEVGYQELLATVAARQILGGPSYDALILISPALSRRRPAVWTARSDGRKTLWINVPRPNQWTLARRNASTCASSQPGYCLMMWRMSASYLAGVLRSAACLRSRTRFAGASTEIC